MKFFKTPILFLSIILLFIACGSDEDVSPGSELKISPTLTFAKLTVNKKDITKEELLNQIQEKEKEGYTIKNILINDTSFADIDRDKMSLKLKKAGTFTIKIILQKKGYQNVTIEATIVYLISEAMSFDKLTTAKNTISKEEIFKQIKGNKDGFTIKSFTLEDSSFAEVKGTAPDVSLTLKKAGDFTAKLVLQKNNHLDVTLNATFSGVPESLTFKKLTAYKKTLTKEDILKQIPEKEKANYTLKSIVLADDTFADVKGTAPNLSLTLKKIGTFKADITLSRKDYLDVTIADADFEHIPEKLQFVTFRTDKKILAKNDILTQIQGNKDGYTITKIETTSSDIGINPTTYSLTLKREGTFTIKITLQKTGYTPVKIDGQIEYKPTPTLYFNKLTTPKKLITKAEIERQIQGAKSGYNIANLSVGDKAFAAADNSNFSLILKKQGRFTVTITLQKTGYFDINLQAVFEGKSETLIFNTLSTYKKVIPKSDILKQVQGGSSYTIKSISVSDNAFATVNANLSLTVKKQGNFTAAITLERIGYFDAIISQAAFRGTSENLSFTTFKTYKKTLTKAEIFAQIDGNKSGYAITRIAVADASYADVSSSNYSLTLKRQGLFKIIITLEKTGNLQKTLNGAIEYRPKPTFTFDRLITSKKTITQADMENQIRESRNGYAITNLVVSDDAFAVADNNNLSLTLKKAGTFTVAMTLGKTGYFDVTITATIQGRPDGLTFDNPLRLTYRSTIPSATIFAQILGAGKTNYTVKSISNISDSTVAQVKGTGSNSYIELKKAGSFDAMIVLERSGYLDVTITTANFVIRKAGPKQVNFDKMIIPYQPTISKATLETRMTGQNAGYTISRVFAINPSGAARLGADKLSLNIEKLGIFTANIVLVHASYEDVTVNAEFEIRRGLQKNLSFSKLTIPHKNVITEQEIFAQITGQKSGYALQRIFNVTPSEVAEASSNNRYLNIKKAGNFTANITLTHSLYGHVTISAQFQIDKLPRKNLQFSKLTSVYKNIFTQSEILARVTGTKNGYTIKDIVFATATDVAELSGANKLSLGIKKAGTFTANITLEHPIYKDATVSAEFEITKLPRKNLQFSKLTISFKNTIGEDDILKQLTGPKAQYTLKNIALATATDVAEIVGVGANAYLNIKKAGSFTANITLEHPFYKDVAIAGAEFEVLNLPNKPLGFTKVQSVYKKLFTESEILARVTGPKTGYTIKSLAFPTATDVAELTGASRLSLGIKKAGIFTVNITLEHAFYSDVTIAGAGFEITKLSKRVLGFSKWTLPHKSEITSRDIVGRITGPKDGYTVKTIVFPTATDVAELSGSGLGIKKAGAFVANITLEHPYYHDTAVPAEFEITKLSKRVLGFSKWTLPYKNKITLQDIVGRITGPKDGYAIKIITFPTATDVAEFKGSGLDIKKAGTFTAKLTLTHPYYQDAAITGAEFEMTKLAKKALRFPKWITHYTDRITSTDIMGQVTGPKGGYTVKTITFAAATDVAEISGVDLRIKKAGAFTTNIDFKHAIYQDVAITGAEFEITKLSKRNLGFSKLAPNIYKNLFTESDILKQVTGSKSGYTLRSITFAAATDVAELTGARNVSLYVKKAGSFAVTLVLKHPVFADETISRAEFEIKSPFNKLKIHYKSIVAPRDIENQLQNLPAGYTLKGITDIDAPDVAALTGASKTSLHIKKSGSFTATLTLQKAGQADVVIGNAEFELEKAVRKKLSFPELKTVYKNHFTERDILQQIQGPKDGYTIKKISQINTIHIIPRNMIEITGAGKAIYAKTSGQFSATLTLEHPIYLDVTLTGATFSIVSPFKRTDSHSPYHSVIGLSYKPLLAAADIESRIRSLTGYRIKSIANIRPADAGIAELTGASRTSLQIKKAGEVYVDITLQKPGEVDLFLSGFKIDLLKLSRRNLGWSGRNPATIPYRRIFTKEQILSYITGPKDGYTVIPLDKTIFYQGSYMKAAEINSGSLVAEISGSPEKNIYIKKTGVFILLAITLEHPYYADTRLISKGFDVQGYYFEKMSIPHKKYISKAEIEGQVKSLAAGYTLKSISAINPAGAVELTGTPRTSLYIKRDATFSFTATITMEKAGQADVVMPNAEFQMNKRPARNLRFETMNVTKDLLSERDILEQVRGPKEGYTLKRISEISASDVAELSGLAIKLKKVGRFTAKILLESPLYSDVEITGAQFEVRQKIQPKKLAFDRIVTYKAFITPQYIIPRIKDLSGAPVTGGYSLKRIANIGALSGASDMAEISGIAIKIKEQEGVFAANLILQHPLYLDFTITGAEFEKEKAFIFNEREKAIVGVTPKYEAYFKTVAEVTFPDQIRDIEVEEIRGTSTSVIRPVGVFGSNNISVKTVHFPKNLKTIGTNAFHNYELDDSPNLLVLPQSLTSIGARAFQNCANLESIDFPNSLETIGEGAFRFSGLRTVRLPNSVTSLGREAFFMCRDLVSLYLSNKLAVIPIRAFKSCRKLTTISIPRDTGILKEIKTSAFMDCSSLRTSSFGKSLEIIGNYAFENCIKYIGMVEPNVKTIGRQAFRNCHELSTVGSTSLETIGQSAFENCNGNLVYFNASGNTLKDIGQNAFKGCTNLNGITLSMSMSNIGYNAFASCPSLTVTIQQPHPTPEMVSASVSTFGDVRSIVVPYGKLKVYKNMFRWRTWRDKMGEYYGPATVSVDRIVTYKTIITEEDILKHIKVNRRPLGKGIYTIDHITNKFTVVSGGSDLVELLTFTSLKMKKQVGVFEADFLLKSPIFRNKNVYKATFEKRKAFIFDKNTGVISGVTAGYKTHLSTATEMTFPDQIEGVDVTEIRGHGGNKESVFGGVNTNLKTIHLPKNLKTIGDYAFTGCSGLSSVVIPDSVTRIETEAFKGCVGLTSMNLPKSVVAISWNAFKDCTGLTSVTLPKTLTTLKDGVFSGCSALASIKLPKSLTSIEKQVFEGCTSLTSITISTPDGATTSIGAKAFKDCTNLVVTIRQPNTNQIKVSSALDTFDDVRRIKVPSNSLATYRTTWSRWRNKMDPMPTRQLSFSNLVTYKALITKEDILAQITELSGVSLAEEYSLKSISNIRIISGGSDLAEELTGLSIKIKRRTGVFTADLVLQHPLYLDMTLTRARFEKQNAFIFDSANKAIVGVTTAYQRIFKQTATAVTFPDQINGVNVEQIKGNATNQNNVFGFSSTDALTLANNKIETIHLPKNLKTIGAFAFADLPKLKAIKVPNAVATIENSAFIRCKELLEMDIESVTTLGQSAFYACDKLHSVKLSNSLVTIEDSTFSVCKALSSITLPDSVTEIKNNAFKFCESLQSVKMSKNISIIGEAAFSHCYVLKDPLNLPNTLTVIRKEAFDRCEKLNFIEIPASLRVLGQSQVFANCQRLVISFKHVDPGVMTILDVNTFVYSGQRVYDLRIVVPDGRLQRYRNYLSYLTSYIVEDK